jgi:signal transduction histidine kinase
MAFSGLKRRFLLSIIAIYLVTALAFLGVLNWVADGIVAQLGSGFAERQVRLSQMESLSPLLREIALARKMADSPILREWAAAETLPELRERALTEMESYRRSFRDGSYFFAIAKSGSYYFNDAKGSYRGQELRYFLDPNKAADRWYFATLKSADEYQINVNPDEHLNVTKVWINVLVRDGQRLLGVLGTGIDLSEFIREVVESDQPGARNIFVDASGAIQADRETSRIDFASLTKASPERKTVFRMIDDDAGRQALEVAMRQLESSEDKVATLFLSVNGRRHLVGVAYLREIRWFAIALIDRDIFMQQGRFLLVAGLFGIALLAALASVTILLDRLVLTRVSRLDASTRDIAAGDYSVELASDSSDELGRLSRNFMVMADTVRDHTAALERTVQATAAKYEEANQRLEAQAQELTRVNAELEQFAYVTSHDLRQPLRMISSYLAMIERRLGGALDDDTKDFLGFAIGGAKRMDQLILDLLDYSRTGRDCRPPEAVDLGEVIAESLRFLDVSISEAGGRIDVAGPFPTVQGNRQELGRLFQNLIGNAVKYRSADRLLHIEIGCREKGSVWEFWVHDNGIGIAETDFQRAFSVFQRLVSRDAYEGTGIGLSVCKKIVEHHHGRIWIESEIDVGTWFRFTLPQSAPCAGGLDVPITDEPCSGSAPLRQAKRSPALEDR